MAKPANDFDDVLVERCDADDEAEKPEYRPAHEPAYCPRRSHQIETILEEFYVFLSELRQKLLCLARKFVEPAGRGFVWGRQSRFLSLPP